MQTRRIMIKGMKTKGKTTTGTKAGVGKSAGKSAGRTRRIMIKVTKTKGTKTTATKAGVGKRTGTTKILWPTTRKPILGKPMESTMSGPQVNGEQIRY